LTSRIPRIAKPRSASSSGSRSLGATGFNVYGETAARGA
jgi:hypothetical protein